MLKNIGKNFNILSYSDKKKYLNNKKIIIKNVSSNSIDFFESQSENVTGIIIDDKKYINSMIKLGKGSYGIIYKFTNIDPLNVEFYAIKEYKETRDYLIEKLIIIILQNLREIYKIKFNIVNSYYNDENKISIMDGYNDDLHNLVYTNEIEYNPFTISLQVIKSIYHLYKYEIYYCDLKLANVLYNLNGTNIDCILADIGSLNFSKKNLYTNLFLNKQLLNHKIKLKRTSNINLCYLGIEYLNDSYKVGLVFVPNNLYLELKDNSNFSIKEINNQEVILEGNDKIYKIDSMYFTLDNAIFTFPHFKDFEGDIPYNNNTFNNVMINNIFQSIGVFIIELLFKSYFKLKFDDIETNFDESINKIREKIFDSQQLSLSNKILLNLLLFGQDNETGLINKNYMENINYCDKFESIIQKLKILEKNFNY
tara:strand:- start:90 stop:1361 length:1272 start_codon:yes stop_codon:yes gene_type:complete